MLGKDSINVAIICSSHSRNGKSFSFILNLASCFRIKSSGDFSVQQAFQAERTMRRSR